MGTDEGDDFHPPVHDVTLNGFYLDKFRVVAARFEVFLGAFEGRPPALGSGSYPPVMNSGWREADTEVLLAIYQERDLWWNYWQDSGGEGDAFEVGTFWQMAQAFCIWDGGRLPTEAEIEFAGAGGDERRLHPWGESPLCMDLFDCESAIFYKELPEGACDGLCDYVDEFSCGERRYPVGSFPLGNARWGHSDIVGRGGEWSLDAYSEERQKEATTNPLGLPGDGSVSRIVRGAYANRHWSRQPHSTKFTPNAGRERHPIYGFRCARDRL